MNHKGDSCYLNSLHSIRTESKLKFHKKVFNNKDLCEVLMPSEEDKILEFKHYMKSGKMPYIIYADIESLIKKIDGCKNNPEKSSATTINEQILCGYCHQLHRRQTYVILPKRLYERVL